MNEMQENAINACKNLLQRLIDIENINNVDELRLILIKDKIKETEKLLDDFGKPLYQRLK